MIDQQIVQAIRRAGGRPMVVGGAVRDRQCGIESKDVDIEVFGISFDELANCLRQFGRVSKVGKSFGVVKLHKFDGEWMDFSLPRRDSKVGEGHTGFDILCDPNMSFAEACSRRDFTINAMMVDPFNGKLIDPLDGARDLRLRILRPCSLDTFGDDPLRVLRGMQFAARFGVRAEGLEFQKLCLALRGEFHTLAVERIWDEFFKMVTKGVSVTRGLDFLKWSGWDVFFPEIKDMDGVPQNAKRHPEGDVLTHVGLVCDEAVKIADRENLRGEDRAVLILAALCHDMGKPSTTVVDNDRITSSGHAEAGVPIAEKFLNRIGCIPRIKERVLPLVAEHMAHVSFNGQGLTDRAVRRLTVRLGKATLQEWAWLVEADHSGRPPLPGGLPEVARFILDKATQLPNMDDKGRPQRIVTGKLLIDNKICEPGPRMGEILECAWQAQLDGEFDDVPSGIQFARKLCENSSG